MASEPGPGQMLAAAFDAYGAPEVLRLQVRERPRRRAGEVLVRLTATAVNPVCCKVRSGRFVPPLLRALPKIPGADVMGIVEEADPGSSMFRRGDRVFGMADTMAPFKSAGSYAQFMAVREAWLTHVPEGVSDETAAAAPLVCLTAWQCLEPANLRPGARVLVHGGSGGLGHVAVQLAKLRGCFVAVTCSAANAAFCKSVGADETVDYRAERFEERFRDEPFDCIVDSIGGDYWARSRRLLKPGGCYAHVLTGAWSERLPFLLNLQLEGLAAAAGKAAALLRRGSYRWVFVQPSGSQMAQIARLMAEGRLRPHVCRSFPLEQASEAHRAFESGHPPGKIVLRIPQPQQAAEPPSAAAGQSLRCP